MRATMVLRVRRWRREWDSNPRTPVKMLLEFQSSAFDRSAISPNQSLTRTFSGPPQVGGTRIVLRGPVGASRERAAHDSACGRSSHVSYAWGAAGLATLNGGGSSRQG